MFTSLNSCISYPPNIYILFPLKILVPNSPPQKNKESIFPTQKRPGRSSIRWMHFCPRLLQLFGVSAGWSSWCSPIWWNISSPQKTGGIDVFSWPPKVGGDFFLLREMGDSGLFQGNLGCSRWWYHAEGGFFRMVHLKRSPKPRDSLNLETKLIF